MTLVKLDTRIMFLQNKLLNNKDNIKFLNHSWEKLSFAIKVFGELLLWLGSCCGPLMVLTLVMLCDFYLVWKPTIYTLLPGSDYKKAFRVAKKEVATFFQTHMKLYYNHEIDGKKYSISSYSSLFIYQLIFFRYHFLK